MINVAALWSAPRKAPIVLIVMLAYVEFLDVKQAFDVAIESPFHLLPIGDGPDEILGARAVTITVLAALFAVSRRKNRTIHVGGGVLCHLAAFTISWLRPQIYFALGGQAEHIDVVFAFAIVSMIIAGHGIFLHQCDANRPWLVRSPDTKQAR